MTTPATLEEARALADEPAEIGSRAWLEWFTDLSIREYGSARWASASLRNSEALRRAGLAHWPAEEELGREIEAAMTTGPGWFKRMMDARKPVRIERVEPITARVDMEAVRRLERQLAAIDRPFGKTGAL